MLSFSQQLIQLAWLYKLWKLGEAKSALEKADLQTIVDYVPYYAVGNLCIAGEAFNTANICYTATANGNL